MLVSQHLQKQGGNEELEFMFLKTVLKLHEAEIVQEHENQNMWD